jgi:uncharacterized protein (TIGR03435 family)
MNLAFLVNMAFGLQRFQLSGLTNADTEMFELAIKVPDGATKDNVKLMWQNLLAERFKLTTHRETREMESWVMVLAKGGLKVKEADGEPALSAAATSPGGGNKLQVDSEGYPKLPAGSSMAIINGKARWRASGRTMEQLASTLGAQLGQPVADGTGVKGKYDFALSWDAGGQRAGLGAGAAAGGAPLAGISPPDNGPDLFRAVQDQLGLKLERKKESVEMLVVDHFERIPTEN